MRKLIFLYHDQLSNKPSFGETALVKFFLHFKNEAIVCTQSSRVCMNEGGEGGGRVHSRGKLFLNFTSISKNGCFRDFDPQGSAKFCHEIYVKMSIGAPH